MGWVDLHHFPCCHLWFCLKNFIGLSQLFLRNCIVAFSSTFNVIFVGGFLKKALCLVIKSNFSTNLFLSSNFFISPSYLLFISYSVLGCRCKWDAFTLSKTEIALHKLSTQQELKWWHLVYTALTRKSQSMAFKWQALVSILYVIITYHIPLLKSRLPCKECHTYFTSNSTQSKLKCFACPTNPISGLHK